MVLARRVLEKSIKIAEKYKSVEVHKEVKIDTGCLLVEDANPIDTTPLKSSLEDYLAQLARDNTQLLLNKICDLPTERRKEGTVAKLPKRRFLLPRFDPITKSRTLVKAQERGEHVDKQTHRQGLKRSTPERDKDGDLFEVKKRRKVLRLDNVARTKVSRCRLSSDLEQSPTRVKVEECQDQLSSEGAKMIMSGAQRKRKSSPPPFSESAKKSRILEVV